jgi:hypothetical protein
MIQSVRPCLQQLRTGTNSSCGQRMLSRKGLEQGIILYFIIPWLEGVDCCWHEIERLSDLRRI